MICEYDLTARLRWCWNRIGTSMKYHGIAFTVLWCAMLAIRLAPTKWFTTYRARQFDRRYGLDTAEIIQPSELGIKSSDIEVCIRYEPCTPEKLSEALSSLPVQFRDYVFIDLGSGKGVALLVASMFPFKRIVGVEWSKRVATIARKNLGNFYHRQQKCHEIEIIEGDATAYELPPEPLVIYLYNPFKEVLVQRMLSNLGESLKQCPRHVVVVYYNPVCKQAFAEAEFLHLAGIRDDDLITIYETQRVAPERSSERVQYSRVGDRRAAIAGRASVEEVST